MAHVASPIPADREPRMWSRDTLTMDVSIISMRVGSMTVIATIHLLTCFWGWSGIVVSL